MYGELIHNKIVVNLLQAKGFILAKNIEDIEEGSRVIIRAHGVSPQEKEKILAKNCIIDDYTCPYVTKIHKIVKKAYDAGKQILICGNRNHPEIFGINGCCEFKALIFSDLPSLETMLEKGADDLNNKFDPEKESILVFQTTYSIRKFTKISEFLRKSLSKLEIFGTICNATETRQFETNELAAKSDLMFVIGSKTSSNTLKLLETCKNVCGETHLLEVISDLQEYLAKNTLRDKHIGITAGASSPESIIREVLQIMSEHEIIHNETEQDISFSEAIDAMPELRRGATVRGTIVRYDSEFVYLDIRDKSEGKIPLTEFTDPEFDLDKATVEHHEIEAVVRSVHNSDMSKDILLSKTRAEISKTKKILEEAFNNKTPIQVKISSVVKDGVIAIFGGIEIYIHRSQLDLRPVENLNDYKGKVVEIIITQYEVKEKRRPRVSGSRRSILHAEKEERKAETLSKLAIGSICEGTVRSLTDFGAFVDLGGVDGLIHVSELSWNRIKHPSEVVAIGDKVQVYVKELDVEKNRISLGYKRIEDDPYHEIETRYPIGTVVKGKVVRMFPFGAFIEIADGVDALCHVSQISTSHIAKPSDVLTEGMEVSAMVREVNNEQRRISVSIREVAPINPANAEGDANTEETEELPTEYIDKGDE